MGLCFSKKTKIKSGNVKEGGPPFPVTQKLRGKSSTQLAPAQHAKTVKEDTRTGQQLSHEPPSDEQQQQQKPQLQHQQASCLVYPHHQQFLLLGTLAPSPSAFADCGSSGSPLDPPRATTPLRASSCTKEEVESILIQCGRLSRSSSASTDRQRRKRSHDLEAEGVCLENGDQIGCGEGGLSSSRPSPRRRRARSREKRSESSERGSGVVGRRVSQSPGRRARQEGVLGGVSAPATTGSPCSSSSNAEMPIKMVVVPATEKGVVAKAVAAMEGGGSAGTVSSGFETKPAAAPALSGTSSAPRSASPQSRSAATTHSLAAARTASPQSRSVQVVSAVATASAVPRPGRSASSRSRSTACARPGFDDSVQHHPQLTRKADQQQPHRRSPSPMGEIDGNRLVAESQLKNIPNEHKNGVSTRAAAESMTADGLTAVGARGGGTKGWQPFDCPGVETSVSAAPAKENIATATVSPVLSVPKTVTAKMVSSRRSSRDLDATITEGAANPNHQQTYASLLLEDIQNYHQKQQHHHPQANSIVDTVADINSPDDALLPGSGDGFSCNWQSSFKGRSRRGAADFLWDPSARRYVSVRGSGGGGLKLDGAAAEDLEPQESAGSNSFVWGPEWEPESADCSSRRCWASASPTCSVEQGEEVDGGGDAVPLPCSSPPPIVRPRQAFLTSERVIKIIGSVAGQREGRLA